MKENPEDWPFLHLAKAFDSLKIGCFLSSEEIKSLEALVEAFTTVSILGDKVGSDVAQIVQEVNTHKHSKSCRKYNNDYRFDYAKLPSPKTIIIKPIEQAEPFLSKKKKNFNEKWIRAWNANMDIQICIGFRAVITYITDYGFKPDAGLMELMKKIMAESK